jgi:excisionase family DNA binding protein
MSNSEWLSLSEAAELLGVHPSTVRLWTDKGTLPAHRTAGGHRRYRRDQVELWATSAKTLEPASVAQSALGQVRFHISESHLAAEGWYQKLDEDARVNYRHSGKALVYGLMSYLGTQDEHTFAEAEADSLGYEYATRARSAGLSLIEAVQAFLFFRNLLANSLINIYQDAHIPSAQVWGDMMRRTQQFTDRVLLKLLTTYQIFEDGQK